MVRITTLEAAAGPGAVIWLVAWMPSRFGIRMSISTTCGRRLRASETAWTPSAASPVASMSGCASMVMRKPARSNA